MDDESEEERLERLDRIAERMIESLRRSRKMHEAIANRLEMAHPDAIDKLINEIEVYLARHGNQQRPDESSS